MFRWTKGCLDRGLAILLLPAVLVGCAAPKIGNQHAGQALFADRSPVAVIVQLPERPNVNEVDPERGGGNLALLQLAIVTGITSKLTAHAKSLPMDDLRAVEKELAAALARKGLPAKVVSAAVLTDFRPAAMDSPAAGIFPRDMRPLRERVGADRLLAVQVKDLGFNYPFSGIIPIPTGDPMAWVTGEAYLVDLRSNALQWYRQIRMLSGVGKAWDEPPAFPALTAKYFEVLERVKDDLVSDLER